MDTQPSKAEQPPTTAEKPPPEKTTAEKPSTSAPNPPPPPSPALEPSPNPSQTQAQTETQPPPPVTSTGLGSFSRGPHFPASSTTPSPVVGPTSSSPAMTVQRGMAIGVPAHQPPRSFTTFQPFAPLPRAEQFPASNSQVRQPIQGIQTIGMIGSLSTSQLRPSSITGQTQQQRPGQSSLRSITPPSGQPKFQGHGLTRGPSLSNNPPLGSQSTHPGQHQWMSTQAKQIHGVPSPSSYRPHIRPSIAQQRPNTPQQHQHTIPFAPLSSSQQQQQQQNQKQQLLQQQKPQQVQQQQTQQQQTHVSSQQEQDHQSQLPSNRIQQTIPQNAAARGLGLPPQKSNFQASLPSGAVQLEPFNAAANADPAEGGNQILSKRSIRELVSQIDPSEKLDADVEDVLVEIADDFIESVTTFACSLAKHRQSKILEAKDILLHVERNWNMTLPGFSGDEIKSYKKPFTNDIHRERLAAIKKSMAGGNESGNVKTPASGHAGPSAKAHSKTPAIGSPNP